MNIDKIIPSEILPTGHDLENVLLRCGKGVEQYLKIQSEFSKINDIAIDRDFQKKFNHFYRVRRSPDWQSVYFSLLQSQRHNNPNFAFILDEIHRRTGRYEASFASKLIATIDVNSVVIDSVVLKNLGLKLPYANSVDRRSKILDTFKKLQATFEAISKSEAGELAIRKFEEKYGSSVISRVKIVDLILWQYRN